MSCSAASQLLGEIESPRPLRATEEKCTFTGWCLLAGRTEPPPVRVTTAVGILSMTSRIDRADVLKRLTGNTSSARCGFVIEGRLPAGVHQASFEAQLPDGTWQNFKTLSLAITPAGLLAEVESPITKGSVDLRVHVEGWALHPTQPIKALSLRYGHQEIICVLGKKRNDVPLLHPDAPTAATSGFASEKILSAGHGPLRIKAQLSDGSVAIARTPLTIEVRSDENIGTDIDLTAARIELSGYARRPTPPIPAKSVRPLNILFILHGSFSSNSALHVAALANELVLHGHDCAVAVPHDPDTLSQHDHPAFRGLTFEEAEQNPAFPDGRSPDLIHAWTTRENVRQLTETVRARHRAKVVVHLEDNEQQILSLTLGRDHGELEKLPAAELEHLVPHDLSHPLRSREFLACADGITVITDKLKEFVPENRPCHLILPAADARHFYPRPIPHEFRRLCGLSPGTTVLFYHGNTHASNATEVRELYSAVIRLNQEGHTTMLLRTGLDRVDFLGSIARSVSPFVIELGQIPHHRHLPTLMAMADIFVQPGGPDAFNDYRFPSKLPEFFSIGRPVVLPRTNLGAQLQDGVDAYVLDRADAAGITSAVVVLREDRRLYERLSQGACNFAEKNFSWRRSAETLANFYSSLTA